MVIEHNNATGVAQGALAKEGGPRRLVGTRLRLPADDLMTVPALFLHVVRARSGEVALRAKLRGIYRETTWSQMLGEITRIALGLHALGVCKGDRVAIVGDPGARAQVAHEVYDELSAKSPDFKTLKDAFFQFRDRSYTYHQVADFSFDLMMLQLRRGKAG